MNQNNFDPSVFEIQDGYINLTKMCQAFDKEVKRWLQNTSTKSFIEALEAEDGKPAIEIKRGGNGEQGTFGTREVAIKLAQWINPAFEVFTIRKLNELFSTGRTQLATKPIDRFDLMYNMLDQMREQDQQIQLMRGEIETIKQSPVKVEINTGKLKDYKTMRKEQMLEKYRRPISDLVNTVYKHIPNFKDRWDRARHDYKLDTGEHFPNVDKANEEQFIDFLNWIKKQ